MAGVIVRRLIIRATRGIRQKANAFAAKKIRRAIFRHKRRRQAIKRTFASFLHRWFISDDKGGSLSKDMLLLGRDALILIGLKLLGISDDATHIKLTTPTGVNDVVTAEGVTGGTDMETPMVEPQVVETEAESEAEAQSDVAEIQTELDNRIQKRDTTGETEFDEDEARAELEEFRKRGAEGKAKADRIKKEREEEERKAEEERQRKKEAEKQKAEEKKEVEKAEAKKKAKVEKAERKKEAEKKEEPKKKAVERVEAERVETPTPKPSKPVETPQKPQETQEPPKANTREITMEELLHSDTAVRLGLNNTPSTVDMEHLRITLRYINWLQSSMGLEFKVTSGYRSEAVNKAVGGKPTSAHRRGYAVDFQVQGMTRKDAFTAVALFLKDGGYKFDQLIKEKSGNSEWIHIGLFNSANQQRREVKFIGCEEYYIPYKSVIYNNSTSIETGDRNKK